MKTLSITTLVLVLMLLFTRISYGQSTHAATYHQLKIDFLEPLVNRSFVGRFNYGSGQHLFGVVAGFGGYISEFDNQQFDTYQDKVNYRLGLEYQYYLSKSKQNRGFYIGGDVEYGSRTVESKITSESVTNISVFTPGAWFGYMWKPFKNANMLVDLTIFHPRYTFGSIDQVNFQTVATPYTPQNLFNFLGPWSVGWRF